MVEILKPVSGKKPIIGLAGFFGYGNYGDELFISVYKEYLADYFDLKILTEQLYKPYYKRPIEEIVSEVDAIVIGGGDIVQPWGMDARYFNRAFLKKPVFIVGVGVPIRSGANVPAHQVEKDWIVEKYRSFFQHPSVKMINARDPQSVNWITQKLTPKIEVVEAPDVVCALTLPDAPKPEGPPILGIVTRQRPNKEDDYSELNKLVAQQLDRGWKIRHIILGSGDVGKRDVLDAADVKGDKELIYTEEEAKLSKNIGECTSLMSMKFHGTVVATMYGIPSTVLIPTNKNCNFMKRIDREDLLARFDSTSLRARFEPHPEPIQPESVNMLRARASALLKNLSGQLRKSIQ